jgi:hypothetical protein
MIWDRRSCTDASIEVLPPGPTPTQEQDIARKEAGSGFGYFAAIGIKDESRKSEQRSQKVEWEMGEHIALTALMKNSRARCKWTKW